MWVILQNFYRSSLYNKFLQDNVKQKSFTAPEKFDLSAKKNTIEIQFDYGTKNFEYEFVRKLGWKSFRSFDFYAHSLRS